MSNNQFMLEAVNLSLNSVKSGTGPFGAVVVKDGKVIGRGHNRVTTDNDPTAHAEVTAIRDAAAFLNDFDLSGCELYTSCYPCPMCLAAAYWAHIDLIYYANTTKDAADIGFDDRFIYEEFDKPMDRRSLKLIRMEDSNAGLAFEEWEKLENKTEY